MPAPIKGLGQTGRSLATLASALCRVVFAFVALSILGMPATMSVSAEEASDALYRETFESYATNANPHGWVDTAVGRPGPVAAGLFKTASDPSRGSGPANVVFGTRASAGTQIVDARRAGTFSTLLLHAFDARLGFELTGRALRMNAEGLLGLALLSQYPDRDDYYLVGMDGEGRFGAYTWTSAPRPGRRRPAVPNRIGLVPLDGTASKVEALTPASWYQFRIRVSENGGATLIAASIWPENEPEPASFEIRAEDASTARLRAGRIAIWSGSRGDVWFDDLEVRSLEPVSAGGPPMISILESGRTMIDGLLVNRDLTPVVQVDDDFDPSPRVDVTLDGNAWRSGSVVSSEGAHTLRVVATDSSGQSAERVLSFEIDKTPPTLSVASPAEGQILASAVVTLSGNVDGAEWVRMGPPDAAIGGQNCLVDSAARTWSSPAVSLLDGANAVTVSAGDRVGNTTSVTRTLLVDTRGPALEVVSPPNGASLNLSHLVLTGRASDERLVSVKVRRRGASDAYDATLANGAWTATIPNLAEGLLDVVVEASDAAGHVTTAAVGYRIDRTNPEIEITEGGSSFLATVVNRVVGLFVRAIDDDPQVSVTSTLDGAAYSSGSAIARDGEHVLETKAVDRAGNKSRRTTRFTVDRVPPELENLSPANGATVGTMPDSITGSCGDATRIELVGTAVSAIPSNGVFALAAVPFDEGTNRFTLRASDAAGNSSELAHVVTVKTSAPTVEILERGTPIAQGALFNRDVTPEIRASDVEATITATLNGATYDRGTVITTDGSYALVARAADALSHVGSHSVTFRIDKTAPVVSITSPVAGAAIAADAVVVTGTCADASSVIVNGVAATVTSGAFRATVPVELGENVLVAVGRDDAGNAGRAEVIVTREGAGPAIVLLHPPDRSLTNRPKTEVLGRVITPASVVSVTLSLDGVTKSILTPDAAGDFRATLDLVEGTHAISATSNGRDGRSVTASVQLTADFTPPSLKILANGAELRDGAMLATAQSLTLDVSDQQTPVPSVELAVDGSTTAAPANITAQGGHVALAIARDTAGNESRLERTFTIGSGGASSGCSITRLDPDPARPAIVVGTSTRISGRTSGESIRIGGTVVEVVSGSFCADVQLPREGENVVEVVCLGAGVPIGDPVLLKLTRVSGLPTVAIDSPMEGQVLTDEAVTVTGSVGPGAIAVSVNGVDATFSTADPSVPRNFVAKNVEIAHGQNLIAVRALTASARAATSTRRVTGAIRAATLSITSPMGTAPTGGASIDVSGIWRDVDPSTITASSGAVVATRISDTDGTFVVRDTALTVGANTITLRGRDAANREVTAQVVVTRSAGVPSIRIDSPADNVTLASGSAATITVSGSFSANEGARVEVNGVGAAISGSTYSAEVQLVATPGVPTMLIARVIEPDGGLAVSSARVARLADPFVVRKVGEALSVFPADGAVSVPVSAQILVGLSHAVNQSSVSGGVVVESAAGQPVAGTLFADREVVSFAPTVPLAEGTAYLVRVKPSLLNGAGETIATEVVTRFMTEFGAPSTAPSLDPLPQSVCGTTLAVSGTSVANGRVRIDFDGVSYTRTTDASGRFSIELQLAAPSGYRVLRVRAIGPDGALSPAAETCILAACELGPSVVAASYDDVVNAVMVEFSANVDPATLVLGTSITLVKSDNRSIGGSVTLNGLTATILPSENLSIASFTLSVTTAVKDAAGRPLVAPFTKSFFPGGSTGSPAAGDGYLTGEVYDATTGRPLAGATVAIGAPASLVATTDARGRYTIFVPEGAHTIEASAPRHTTVWRQVLVRAGAGVVPIDIRLEATGETGTVASGDLTISDGAAAELTKPASLNVVAGSLTAGTSVTLTSVGAQSLAGLLPLGWSPFASSEIVVRTNPGGRTFQVRPAEHAMFGHTPLAASLTFPIDAAAITNAAQTITAVHYDAARNEWIVVAAAVTVDAGTKSVTITIPRDGAYALVYCDKGPGLATPDLPVTGSALRGVADPCLTTDACGPLAKQAFTLDPPIVAPNQRTTATLRADSALTDPYSSLPPSGTAVQAYIDEELTLSDGSTISDPPFATDLVLYRDLDGAPATAAFHLAPSKRATEVFLQVGWEHIRIHPYPGRLDRGTLIGNEGGRVPGDGSVTVDIPAGATPEPVRAEVRPIKELEQFGTINGFTPIAAFEFLLSRAGTPVSSDLDGDGQPDPIAPVELFKSATATVNVSSGEVRQLVLAEAAYVESFKTTVFRLVSTMGTPAAGEGSTARVSTQQREGLPLDGIVREGRYLLLAANQPIAYATGLVRLGSATGPVASDARVSALDAQTSPLGVVSITRATGIYAMSMVASSPVLRPETRTLGQGTPHTHPSAVAASSILPVDLVLAPQGPTVVSSTPANGATEVSLTTPVQVQFSASIDPTSITAESITVINSLTGTAVPGATVVPASGSPASQFVTWNLAKDTGGVILPLKPNARYTVRIVPTLRGTNGAQLGTTHTFSFATITQFVGDNQIHPERIRITIPDANGVSQIIGEARNGEIPGALPKDWIAIPVRRGRDFVERYQDDAEDDQSFAITIGTAPGDAVSITDVIDLQVVNTEGILAGIIRLTPFVTADGRGFIAPPERETRFTTSPDNGGVTVIVPAGAFETPTLVTVTNETKAALNAVPKFDTELAFTNAVRIAFDGTAKKRLQVEFPVPPGTNTATPHLVGLLGQSTRGARLMIVDTLRVAGERFTTLPAGTASQRTAASRTTNASLTPGEVKDSLAGMTQIGVYVNVSIIQPWVFAAIEGLQGNHELFWDTMQSLYASSQYLVENRGRVVIPVLANQPFRVTGVDASTGLESFTKLYDPILPGDPGVAVGIPTPDAPAVGPYPVYGSPFRVESLDLPAEGEDIKTIRDFVVRAANGYVTVTTTLPASVPTSLFNVSRGELDASREGGLRVQGKAGDRIVIMSGATDVNPSATLSVVFSEPISVGSVRTDDGVDAFLRSLFTLEKAASSSSAPLSFVGGNVTPFARFRADSGGRRILVDLPAELEHGATYRLTVSKGVQSASTPLTIGQSFDEQQRPQGGLSEGLRFQFSVAAPAGVIGEFDIRQSASASAGRVRDLALNGNVLLIAALEGGLLAYDTSDAAALTSTSLPLGYAPPTHGSFWSLATDHHGRIVTATVDETFTALRTYRLEDFAPDGEPKAAEPRLVAASKSSALLSFAPGANAGTTLSSSAVLTEIPEALPRKIQLAVQDTDRAYESRAAFKTATGASVAATDGGDERLRLAIPMESGFPYNLQRITVENLTRGFTWSADATPTTPARFEYVVAGEGDRLRIIFNQRTYGVVTLFGYGLAVYDLNAAESNDAAEKRTGYTLIREKLRLTRGAITSECPFPAPAEAIQDLTFSPEALVLPESTGSANLNVFAVEPRRGIVDLTVPLGSDSGGCDRNGEGLILRGSERSLDHPRLQKLRQAFVAKAGREPLVRFGGGASFHWEITAGANLPLRPARKGAGGEFGEAEDIPPGARGSVSGLAASREYMLVPGNEAGLLVVEIGGTPPSSAVTGYRPLGRESLVDVIWIPNGAWAVRMVPGTELATVVDGLGHLLLVDLSKIDERYDLVGDILPYDQLFRTAARCLAETRADGVGAPDPRIVWRSPAPVVTTTLAPVVDPDTGLVLGAADKKVKVVAATEPRLRVMADLGEPGLSEVGGIVPLGVDLPADIASHIAALDSARRAKASLAAFRLELTLPGGAAERLPDGKVHIALESERVFGAPATQTAAPLPLAHFRTSAPNGGAESRPGAVMLERAVPASMAPFLRRQRGFNRFVSPWIVAIADPRASEKYTWVYPADATTDDQKRAFERSKGCAQCARPQHLRGANGTLELFSAGRLLATRVDGASPIGGLKYVGTGSPLVTRIASVPADTVRAPEVLVATQNPPVADGLIDGLVYLHSGELVLAAADLDAGGRAAWNVSVDRTYSSRTMLGTDLGLGWDSSLFRRLRALPNGDVEYRDGMGNLHVFKALSTLPGGAAYDAPAGLLLRLARRGDGWTITDQQRRVLTFDSMGRILSASDEFYKGDGIDAGNVVRYLYDEHGQLGAIVDPVGRTTRLTYWQDTDTGEGRFAGLLREARDWRERTVLFEYDSTARLTRVRLPEVAVADGVPAKYEHKGASRPTMEYEYTSLPTSYNDVLEFAGNLLRRRMPTEVSAGGPARATYTYDQTGDALKRDRLTGQLWATADTVLVEYKSQTEVETTDARGQKRKYALTTPAAEALDRSVHIDHVTLVGVAVQPAVGTAVSPAAPSAPTQDLTTYFTYQAQGMVESVSYPGGLYETNTWVEPPLFARGIVLETQKLAGGDDGNIFQRFAYQIGGSTVALGAVCRSSEPCPETYDANSAESAEKFRVAAAPNRDLSKVERIDKETKVKSVQEYGTDGQLKAVRIESSENGAVASEASVVYWGTASAGLIERGQPFLVTRGSALRENVTYKILPGGGQKITTKDMIRGTESVLELDAYDRPVKRQVLDGTTPLVDERFGYDKNGELAYEMRRQSPLGLVETFHEFDELGRPVKASLTQASVDGALSTIVSKTEYSSGNRTVTTWDPASEGSTATAKTTVEMDGLGRTSLQTRISADGSLKESVRFGYDERGLPSYQSDTVRTASQTERDAFGRETKTLRSDGTSAAKTWNAWGELTDATESTKPGEGGATGVVARTVWQYSAQGTLWRTLERQHALFRATEKKWDGAKTELRIGVTPAPGSDLVADVEVRAVEETRDTAGRITSTRAGGYYGARGSLDDGSVFAKSTVSAFSGDIPSATESTDRNSWVSYKTASEPDALGRPRSTLEAGSAYRTALRYDESSNVLGLTAPGMAEAGASYDSRGLVISRTWPDGTVSRFSYDALGNIRKYTDESGETTEFDTDALGRVTAIRFADGTREETRYENATGDVLATRDRAGLWLSYHYDSGGRVESVHLGEDPAKAPTAVRYTYDGGGRVTRIANPDAAVEFGDYDELGNPGLTRSVRYSGSSGLGDAPVASDTHTQGHVWSVFSERTRWRMPAAGATLPASSDSTPDASTSWLTWIVEGRDAAGNVSSHQRADGAKGAAGTAIEYSSWRGAGRPESRRLFTSAGEDLLTSQFRYADGAAGKDAVTGPVSGLLGQMETRNANRIVLAGSLTTRDTSRRLASATDLGMKRRASAWTYDDRGRLATAKLLTLVEDETAKPVVQPATIETLSSADFRELRDAAPARLTQPQRALLGLEALDVEPPKKDFAEITGHRIDGVTASLGTIAAPERDFAWGGGRRTSDGRWSSSYDSFGRVVRVENADRSIDYVYGPNGRIVGRLAQRASGTTWVTEDRGSVLADDGLPASTTWVWDPVTDRLAAIYEAGRSMGATDPQAGLLRQYLHGDVAYDDPVLAKVAVIAGASPNTFAPILDHAATGSLQAVVRDDGTLVERVLYADAYGDAPRYLQGAVADQMVLELEKNGDGEIAAVRVRVRFSEPVVEDRLATGLRLASVTLDGAVATATTVKPVLEDETAATVLWDISGAEWKRLTDRGDAAGLEIAVGDELRFEAWGSTPVAPAPEWARKVYGLTSQPGWPIIKRESLTSIRSQADALGAGEKKSLPLFEVNDLYLFARKESKSKLLTGFHGAPFVENATGYAFFRARWMDPATGTFLSADPQLFADSSNAYAFCAGDPINCSDPTGELGWWDANIDPLDEEGKREFRGFASGAVGALPVFGEATDLLQAATGYDFIAGEQLEPWEQALAAGSVIVPFGGARVLRKATGAGVDVARGTANIVDATKDAEHYLISQRRAARYEARLRRLQATGYEGERLAELSGRIEMIKFGYLDAGPSKLTGNLRRPGRGRGNQGFDRVYRRFGRPDDLVVLESKFYAAFKRGDDPVKLLDETLHGTQMSREWGEFAIQRMITGPHPARTNALGWELGNTGFKRYMNVLNARGESFIYGLVIP